MKSKGFTLIELLVVVLIIGILAAIAVPQYEKAVMKARIAEAKTTLKALVEATQIYILTNDETPPSMDKLDVRPPASGNWRYWYRSCAGRSTKPGCSISATPLKPGLPVVGTETRDYDPINSLYGVFEAIENDSNITNEETCFKYGGEIKSSGTDNYCDL